jgi:hypothetical protein
MDIIREVGKIDEANGPGMLYQPSVGLGHGLVPEPIPFLLIASTYHQLVLS